MAFGWLIKHQKKVLFVLAVVLIFGWGLSVPLRQLLAPKRGTSASDASGRIAGEVVTRAEYYSFKRSWIRVLRGLFTRESLERQFPGRKVTVDDVVWAYLGLLKLAEQNHIPVSDREVLEHKRMIYQSYQGRAARLDENAERWFREALGVTGRGVDHVVREYLLAEKMLSYMASALEPTDAEAWEDYSRENRSVRARTVVFSRDDYVGKVPEPDDQKIKEYYDSGSRPGGPYAEPATVQIEYARVDLEKLEAAGEVTVAEMKEYYEKNKDLYRVEPETPEGEAATGEATASAYLPFPEVKPQIDGMLKRQKAREQAAAILDNVRQALSDAPEAKLEELLKTHGKGMADYHQTPYLTEVELLEVPGIGSARAEGRDLVELVFSYDPEIQHLSTVMTTPEAWFVFRPLGPVREGIARELADVRDQVVSDIKRVEAFERAAQAAQDFFDEVEEAGGAERFDEQAAKHGLAPTETPFFYDEPHDVNRPVFLSVGCPLKVGGVYGPMSSRLDGVSGVLKVVAERPAERAGFAGERALRRDAVLRRKVEDFRQSVFPETVKTFAGYEDLRPPSELTEEEEAEAGADTSTPGSDNE